MYLISWWSISLAQNESMFFQQALINAKHYQQEVEQIKEGSIRQESIKEHLQKVGHTLVFLSFSMPEKSLEGWLKQCKQHGATPVIRGLIHNSFQETIQKVQGLSVKTDMGLQIDPILFRIFNINQVPAVVKVEDYHCAQAMNCKEVSFSSIYGDVTLEYALQKMNGV